jgi:hypothetical protein
MPKRIKSTNTKQQKRQTRQIEAAAGGRVSEFGFALVDQEQGAKKSGRARRKKSTKSTRTSRRAGARARRRSSAGSRGARAGRAARRK